MARERIAFRGGRRPVSDVGPVFEGPSCVVILHAEISVLGLGADPEETAMTVRVRDVHASP